MDAAVHIVMGREEAQVIGTALEYMLSGMDEAMKEWPDRSESDRNEFMGMLSMKLCAEGMYESLVRLFRDEVEGEFDDE